MKRKFNRDRLPIDHVDIRDLLEELGILYTEQSKNVSQGWVGVRCPFCDDDSNHLGINIRSKTISCWKCGETGTIIKYLSSELRSFDKALSIIQKFIPSELKLEKERERSGVSEVLLPKNALPGLSEPHKIYLQKRGYNPKILTDKYNLHHVGPVGKYKNRIIVPVMKNYRLVTFTTIDIHDESDSRYIHNPEEESIISIKDLLYNSETVTGNSIIVVEGLFDCWRIGDGCSPLWGVKYTPEQVRLLSKYYKVKIVGDGDREGWNLNRMLSAELAAYCQTSYFDLEKEIDPDKLTEEEINHIRRV